MQPHREQDYQPPDGLFHLLHPSLRLRPPLARHLYRMQLQIIARDHFDQRAARLLKAKGDEVCVRVNVEEYEGTDSQTNSQGTFPGCTGYTIWNDLTSRVEASPILSLYVFHKLRTLRSPARQEEECNTEWA